MTYALVQAINRGRHVILHEDKTTLLGLIDMKGADSRRPTLHTIPSITKGMGTNQIMEYLDGQLETGDFLDIWAIMSKGMENSQKPEDDQEEVVE